MSQTAQTDYIVALAGGLGNQMFQYAMGRSLALRHGGRLVLDTRYIDTDPQRSFALDQFRIAGDIANLPPHRPPSMGFVGQLKRRFAARFPPRGKERSFPFDPKFLQLRAPVRVEGFWQTEKYFFDYQEEIRADFQLRVPFSLGTERLLNEIARFDSSVSVHVRRGDYVTNPAATAHHGTCSIDWYLAAKKMLTDRVPNAKFVIFSDDPEWAKEHLAMFGDAMFVSPSRDRPDAHDQRLMSACSHHIIANSSFSWWAAWLNDRKEKIVIAPNQWFLADLDTKDLLPDSWIRL